MADLEKRSRGPLKPSKIRTSVRKRWRRQKKHKSEVETANSQVGRLKHAFEQLDHQAKQKCRNIRPEKAIASAGREDGATWH